MGGTQTTSIKSANSGIDWDNGKFMIFPEVKMIENEGPNYKEAYNILIEYFDSISDEEKPKVHKRLEKIGL